MRNRSLATGHIASHRQSTAHQMSKGGLTHMTSAADLGDGGGASINATGAGSTITNGHLDTASGAPPA